MRILLAGVIYPAAMEYYNEMMGSALAQTDPDFDMLIVNDGVELPLDLPVNCAMVSALGDPFDNRMQTIDYAIANGYDYICWLDADDRLPVNRISGIKTLLNEDGSDILIHDLLTMDAEGNLSGRSFIGGERRKITLQNLLYYNLAGFGNSVVSVPFLKEHRDALHKPSTPIAAVDWWLMVNLLMMGATAVYVPEGLYEYRIYDSNMSLGRDPQQILAHIKVILKHYDAVMSGLASVVDSREMYRVNTYYDLLRNINQEEDIPDADRLNESTVWWEDVYRQLMR